ncbi:hypothetical protein I6A84_30610 [Frankia sp. CNm7]|uniref:Uncharacterized protein n=1 Tax=Frankia nepalensis TaxID=1836974 RepID=A0A937USC0_9ACTN|nr:hypothetical protein [Frankia nepalensis]MBL7495069.1 hypothetical protein [Frankia nepalensis]MBL7515329.1 hypothetical protein [Frankia nepalensis]MBL7522316.1 hypothetical protein [Frankia nepalensis]MBL7632312.1 hypothetical protein [Frankia nepalensis]
MTTSPIASETTTPEAASGTAGLTLSEPSRQAFTAELDKLKAGPSGGPRDRTVQVLGLVVAIIGLVVTLICYSQATAFDDLRDQIQIGILGLFGLGLVVLGSVLYAASTITRFLRLWLLRLIYEQRDRGA